MAQLGTQLWIQLGTQLGRRLRRQFGTQFGTQLPEHGDHGGGEIIFLYSENRYIFGFATK